MRRDLAERTEDAIVAYLKATVSGDIRVSAAWEREEPEYPCAVVHCGTESPVSDDAAWHDARIMAVQVAVMSEGAPELDDSGNVVRTARERNADARSSVLDALCVADLNAQLVAQAVDSVAFSMAQVGTCERTVDGVHLVTTINLEVIAEPVTGS